MGISKKRLILVGVVLLGLTVDVKAFTGWGQNEMDDENVNDLDDTSDDEGMNEMDDSSDSQSDWGQNDEYEEYQDEGRAVRASNSALWNAGVQDHNKYRKIHGSPPVTGDPKLHASAQKYADYLASTGLFQHSPTNDENLAVSNKKDKVSAVRDAIKRWYDEVKLYKYNKPGFSTKTGHFVAVVWKSHKNVGIGVAKYTKGKWKGSWAVVAKYHPILHSANYKENVKPPVG